MFIDEDANACVCPFCGFIRSMADHGESETCESYPDCGQLGIYSCLDCKKSSAVSCGKCTGFCCLKEANPKCPRRISKDSAGRYVCAKCQKNECYTMSCKEKASVTCTRCNYKYCAGCMVSDRCLACAPYFE
jgi:hypothetical protein